MLDHEDVLTVLRSTLQNNLPSALDAIDASKADGITLEDPVGYYIGSSEQRIEAFPALVLEPQNVEWTEEGERYDRAIHTIEIYVYLVGSEDVETLTKRLLRTIRAIRDVIADDPSLGNQVGWCRVASEDYSPVVWPAENVSAQAGMVIVEVYTTA
jgi:hypothetical protein